MKIRISYIVSFNDEDVIFPIPLVKTRTIFLQDGSFASEGVFCPLVKNTASMVPR